MRRFVLATVALLTAGCGEDTAGPEGRGPGTIAREIFVETLVELRMEALDNTPRVITPEERAEILEAHGVTEEELREFVELRGENLEYMRDLWADIEARVLAELDPDAAADSAARQN